MKLTGENRRTRGQTCPSATLSTTNPTWTDPGSNPGLRSGRPAANRLTHGTGKIWLTYPTSTIWTAGIVFAARSRRFYLHLHNPNSTVTTSGSNVISIECSLTGAKAAEVCW
jgi:hypothetical protein